MLHRSGLITVLFLLLSSCLYAQQKVSGRVTDKNTGTPIAFATIQVKGEKSTLTNENGEFDLMVKELPVSIIISHLNFEGVSATINNTVSSLSLVPKTLTLKEVSVGNPALAIMQEASDKAMKNYDHATYGKAFLRQIAYEGDKPTYMNEIFLNAEWKPFGLIAWHPTEARHLKAVKGISYSNTSFFSFILSGYLANSVHKKPLLVSKNYIFKLEGTFEQNGEEIAKISCIPTSDLKGDKRFEGSYYINTVTNDVLKIEGVIKAMNFKASGPVTITNKETTFIAQYKLNAAGDNVLDYSIFNSSNRLRILGIGTQSTSLFSTLYMISDQPVNKEELEEVSSKINDSNLVKAMTYNEEFWKKNQGIKRTEKEKDAIEILEKIPQKNNANHF